MEYEITQEEKEKIFNAFKEICNVFEKIYNEIKRIIEPIIKWLVELMKNVNKYKKCNAIYTRTKSKRIRKKQIMLLRKAVI